MQNQLVFSLALILLGCGAKVSPKPISPSERLKNAYEEKLRESYQAFDQKTGWPSATDCDATLWAGLALAAGNTAVKIALAEYQAGEIHRRPRPSCWDGQDNGAKTTISRDMLTGYIWGLWSVNQRDALERLQSYGKAHNFFMGRPSSDGRTVLSGNGRGILARAIANLGGVKTFDASVPTFFTSSVKDYEAHLTVLNIILNGEVSGGIRPDEKDVLNSLKEKNPQDALMCIASAIYRDGQIDECTGLLLASYQYPSYVRGHENYKLVHWLFTAHLALGGKV